MSSLQAYQAGAPGALTPGEGGRFPHRLSYRSSPIQQQQENTVDPTPEVPLLDSKSPIRSRQSFLGGKQQARLTQAHDTHRRLSCSILLPTLIIFVLTSGLGLGILAWLFAKSKTPASQGFRLGHILVDEGTTKLEGTVESATLRALTATSFISTIIAATSPVLMSLVAYRIAYLWVMDQAGDQPRRTTGPTPLQYGLMLQVLSASSIISLQDAVFYLIRGRSRRPNAPSYFTTAVVMGVVVYVITHLIGLADLWLHATTTAVLYNVTSSTTGSELLMTSFKFNETYCDKFDFPPLDGVCMASLDGWAQKYPWLVDAGQSVVSNSSVDRMTITLADANDTAITVPLSVNKLAKFTATTFGMRARCDSLNNKCDHDSNYMTNCTNIGITAIPSNSSTIMSVALVPPATGHNWNGPPIRDSGAILYGLANGQAANPVASVLQLRWSSQTDGPTRVPNPAADTYPIPAVTVYASCSIDVLNATVTYDGAAGDRNWELVPEGTVLAEDRFATALISPYSWQLVTDRLTTNIRARAMLADTTEEVMSLLNQELGRLALGIVSGSFIFVPATNVEIIAPTILGRYLLAPLLSFVALLLLYGLIALFIFIMTTKTTTTSVHIPAELRDKDQDKTIPELDLAQMRLMSPLPVVAQLFAEYQFVTPGASDPDARSAKSSVVGLFAEDGDGRENPIRLRIGLEDGNSRPRYGVWKSE